MTAIQLLEFFVAGEPVPEGSTKAFYIKKLERVVTTHANKSMDEWRLRIATEAQAAAAAQGWAFVPKGRNRGIVLTMIFRTRKPPSVPKSETILTKRPDLDKLLRAGMDALTDVLFEDDSQVYSLDCTKRYCKEDEAPGVEVSIMEAAE